MPCYSKDKINPRIFVKEREQNWEDLANENSRNLKRLSKADKKKLKTSPHTSSRLKLMVN